MRGFWALAWLATLPLTGWAQKDRLVPAINAQADAHWTLAKQLWDYAEPGYQEKRSAAALMAPLTAAGFKLERGVAGIPTAFTATFGSGTPVIAILGEYDALPGLSQEAVPFKQPRVAGGYGHGCGHHLFGVASMAACLALAEQHKAGKLTGTIRFYGCPAEEGGAAKAFMVRAGLFNDCTACLHWHPGNQNAVGDGSCLARIAAKFRFHGTAAHASGSPERGRSALDAVELTNHAAQLLREHTPDFTRIHHVITDGGGAPNVVPDFAEVYFYIRHPSAEVVSKLYPRLLKCAQAGALATETRLEVIPLGGTRELLPNETIAKLVRTNLTALNDLKYNEEELKFATRLQESFDEKRALDNISTVYDTSGKVGKGSTDVGDVSWVVPTAGFNTACFVPGTPGHSWQAVACGGTTIARQGMLLAARTLATTAWDLFHDPQALTAAKAEFTQRRGPKGYVPLLEPNQQPPLDYRNAPRLKTGD